jgi:hypothetical protein
MMGGKTPETCRAVNKIQGNELENCCIWLVIYLNSICFFSRVEVLMNKDLQETLKEVNMA